MDIRVEHLTKKYGAQKAIDDLSFEVKTGEILGFLGPNGAGKTTTMKSITCFMAPSSGDVLIGNYSIHKDQEKIKQLIGYLPEHNPLYLDMHVIDYLAFAAALQAVPKSRIDERIREMVRICGLDKEKHKKIGELSKGYRQRVGLAQAMIHDPEILILDEPTTGLDPNQIVEIRELIKEIGKAKTVLLSTHILPEVEATCDRIIIINNGQIVADGSPDQLRREASGKEISQIKIEDGSNAAIFEALQRIASVELVDPLKDPTKFQVQSRVGESSRRAIFNVCRENNWVLTEMTPIERDLEDVFRNVTLN
ncbi:UNVERIFIED_CONTAM: hypothetical protein GTU68_062633 [Idotea baltica]|nr:hypothetical protein [Idotea baltica]